MIVIVLAALVVTNIAWALSIPSIRDREREAICGEIMRRAQRLADAGHIEEAGQFVRLARDLSCDYDLIE